MRLGKKQRTVLEQIRLENDSGTVAPGRIFPAYIDRIGRDLFDYERERDRFVESLAKRGWVEIRNRHFLHITDEGRKALGAKTP